MTAVSTLLESARQAEALFTVTGSRVRVTADKPLPDELLYRLRSRKEEVLAALMSANGETIIDPGWPAETRRHIEWFLSSEPPSDPFELVSGVTILKPETFWGSIRQDIWNGPGRHRDFWGAVRNDLRRLYEKFGPGAEQGLSG